MKISILEKVRAPSRIAFCLGLVVGDNPTLLGKLGSMGEFHRTGDEPEGNPERGKPTGPDDNQGRVQSHRGERRLATDELERLGRPKGRDESRHHKCEAHDCHHWRRDLNELVYNFLLQGAVLGGTLPQRSAGYWNSDDIVNIAYMDLKVKLNRKSLYSKAFSGIQYWIKKFSSPKIKIWFEPMFFSGFFCGFERCGSAALPNFRGGTSSPPAAAKCVRTNSRILHNA